MNKKYIDADEFVKEINDRIDAAFKWGKSAVADNDEEIKTRAEQAVTTFCEAILTAMKMPDANVQEIKHGRWTNLKMSISGNSSAECSLCGAVVYESFTNSKAIHYCPNCGARMDEVLTQSR